MVFLAFLGVYASFLKIKTTAENGDFSYYNRTKYSQVFTGDPGKLSNPSGLLTSEKGDFLQPHIFN